MTDHRSRTPPWGTLDYYIRGTLPRHIDVCNAALNDDDAIRLADALLSDGGDGRSGGADVKMLRLRGGRITSAGLLALAEAIGGVAGSTSALEELDLGCNPEIASDVEDFAFGMFLILSAAGRLKRLTLDGCLLGSRVGMALADIIAIHGESLEELNLRSNALEDDATICIARRLGNCKQLTSVDLGENFIGLRGASALAEALATNPPLQHLNLWGNMLEDAGVVPLARSLKQNDTLISLYLGYNRLSDVGLEAILHAIFDASSLNGLVTSNHTLRYIFYDHCTSDLLRRGCDVRTLFDLKNILQLNEVNALLKKSDGNLPEWAMELPLTSMSIEQMKVVIYLSKCFDMRHFLDLDRTMVPQALEFVSAHLGCDKVFRLVGEWNMPQLFLPEPRQGMRGC